MVAPFEPAGRALIDVRMMNLVAGRFGVSQAAMTHRLRNLSATSGMVFAGIIVGSHPSRWPCEVSREFEVSTRDGDGRLLH